MTEISFDLTTAILAISVGAGWALLNFGYAARDGVAMARAARAWIRDRRRARADGLHDYQIGLSPAVPPALSLAAAARRAGAH